MQLSSLNENAQKWVRALRSGIFQQGRSYLNQDVDVTPDAEKETMINHMCCLGVACELAILDGIPVPKKHTAGVTEYEYSTGLPPINVVAWLGLRDNEGTFDDPIIIDTSTGPRAVSSLVELNDNGYSFEDIADLIEKNPNGLFRQ